MKKHMEETRTCIQQLIQNQQQTVMSQEYMHSYKWLWDFPGVGGLILPWASEDMKEALRNYAAKNDKYKIMVAQGDQERAHLLKSIDTARGLIENIDGVMEHLDEAKKSLDNIFDGMTMMNMSRSTLRKKLESIDGNVKTEAHGSSMSKLYINMAVTSWNNVLEVARSFAKHGIIEEVTDTNTPTRRGQAVILAASYGGQTVTDLAKMQLNYGTKIVISTKDLIFPPGTLQGKPKALSILYRFGDDPDSWRTFTCDTGTEQVHTLTADSSHGTEVAVNFRKDTSSRYKIHAIVYGLRQITDKAVLIQVASAAEIAGALLVHNTSFGVNSSNDPWYGKLKTAAIFYTVDGFIREFRPLPSMRSEASWLLTQRPDPVHSIFFVHYQSQWSPSLVHMPVIHQASIFHLLQKPLDFVFAAKSKPSSRWESDTHRDSGNDDLGPMTSIFSGKLLKFLFITRCSSDPGELGDYNLLRLLILRHCRVWTVADLFVSVQRLIEV
ncbi:hypothetical protein FOXYSP1_13254 [Fusarium oxysporum f. sp. phaseoli]